MLSIACRCSRTARKEWPDPSTSTSCDQVNTRLCPRPRAHCTFLCPFVTHSWSSIRQEGVNVVLNCSAQETKECDKESARLATARSQMTILPRLTYASPVVGVMLCLLLCILSAHQPIGELQQMSARGVFLFMVCPCRSICLSTLLYFPLMCPLILSNIWIVVGITAPRPARARTAWVCGRNHSR